MDNKDNFYFTIAIPAALVIGIGIGVSYCKYFYIKQKNLLLEQSQEKFTNLFNEKEKKLLINLELFKQTVKNDQQALISDMKAQREHDAEVSTNKLSVIFQRMIVLGLEQLATQVEITGANEQQHLSVKRQFLEEAEQLAEKLELLQQVQLISDELQKIARQLREDSSLMLADDDNLSALLDAADECSSLMIEYSRNSGSSFQDDKSSELEDDDESFSIVDLVNSSEGQEDSQQSIVMLGSDDLNVADES